MKIVKTVFTFLIASILSAQTEDLTISSIWNYDFHPKRMESINQMTFSNGFTSIDINSNKRISSILFFNYQTTLTDTIISNTINNEIPFFTEYNFSKNEDKILIETQVDKIYRRSKQAIYFVYDVNTKKINKLFDEKIQEPLFSPDGEKVAFVYRRNIFIKDLLTKKINQITYDGDYKTINGITDWVYEEEFGFVRAFDWSLDSKKIVFMRFDESKVPIFSMDIYGKDLYQFPFMFRYPKAGESNSVVSIKLFDYNSKKVIDLDFGKEKPYYFPRLKFAGGKNSIIVHTMNRNQNHLKLWKINIENMTSTILLEEKDKFYLSIHDNLFFLDDDSFLWTSEIDGFNHIYYYSKEGKFIRKITTGDWEVTDFYRYKKKSKEIFYQSVENGSTVRNIYSIKISGKSKKNLTPINGYNGAYFSIDGEYFINSYSDEKTPPVYTLRKSKNGEKIKILLNNNDLIESLSKFKLSEKEFSKITINGENLNMWMIKPYDFDSKKKYPLLMFQYSGPGSQEVSNRWGDERNLWHKKIANMGYIIACVDGRGTGFKGAKFKKITYMNLVKYESIDQISAAKKLRNLPFINSERIGIWGWSFGGHMATHCLLKGNDVFSMAIAVAPVTNWRFYDTIYTERFMRTPQENPDGYDLNSPINYAEDLKGKLLIIHGSADDNVHVQNTMRMVEALIEKNKQFEWMVYPDKNHGIYGGNTTNHLYTKMTNFIKNNL
jgi:dipeptidyl-peptidase-4